MGFSLEYENRKNGKVAIITIDCIKPNNTLDRQLLLEFTKTLQTASQEADAMLVTSANDKFFSNGLDGATLLKVDKEERVETIREMIQVFGKLIQIQKPWVVEIAGHAMAGGAVISAAADNRFMIKTGARIGFSEMLVGMVLPTNYIMGFQRFVHPRVVREMMYGAAYKAEEALEIGLVDGVAEDKEILRKMCMKQIDGFFRFHKSSFLLTRNLYREEILRDIFRVLPNDFERCLPQAATDDFVKALENIAKRNQ
ncbi:MAG: enoyl-CoA hydratase/isomerase family protein [Leptospiraceae bacterium]|nr:enoyl-CoA hydratase/isomerase family protein [Leptospiraceae bacterium]MCP5494225.1 enoyl-CoA hydratase/isomerase family protein [Leptospiraceae bacterium]